jgi:chromosome segregation ATPase
MATRDEVLRFLLKVSGEKDLETLSRALEMVGDEAAGSEGKASALAEEIDKLITASRKTAEFARLAAEVEQLSSEFDYANERAYSFKSALQATESPSAELSKEFKRAAAEVERLAAAQSKARTQLEAVGGELRKTGVDVDRLADEQERLRREAAEATTALTTQAQRMEAARAAAERNAKALDKMADGLSRIRSGLNDASSRLLKIGAAAAAAAASLAVFGTARFFTGAIESAGNFETAIAAGNARP